MTAKIRRYQADDLEPLLQHMLYQVAYRGIVIGDEDEEDAQAFQNRPEGERHEPSSHPRSTTLRASGRFIGEVTTLRKAIIAIPTGRRKSVAVT